MSAHRFISYGSSYTVGDVTPFWSLVTRDVLCFFFELGFVSSQMFEEFQEEEDVFPAQMPDPDPATSTTTPLPVQQSIQSLSTIPLEENIAPGVITSAVEFVPDPSPATRHDTLPTVTDAGLLVRTAAEALHFNLELLSLLVRELGGDRSATTISELTKIPSSDAESAIRSLQFDGVAIRPLQRGALIWVLAISAGSRGVSPASAGCTFATASTHTDACHSMLPSVITLLLSMWFRGRHWSVPVLALGFAHTHVVRQ